MSKFEEWYREFCGVDDPDEIVLVDGQMEAAFQAGQRAGLERAAEIVSEMAFPKDHYDKPNGQFYTKGYSTSIMFEAIRKEVK